MFHTIKKGWNTPEIRNRILFTFLMIIVFRIGSAIPVPFMNAEAIKSIMNSEAGSMLGFVDLLSGGSLAKMSVFALSIYPYITASIIIQLLTVAIPSLGELARDGEHGQRKINQYTKYGAIFLGLFEGYALINRFLAGAVIADNILQKITILVTVIAGSMFLVWLGDMITEKGIGNGISIIVFLGIISQIPDQIVSWIFKVKDGQYSYLLVAILVAITILVVFIVVAINEGERRIPVQYAKRVVGRKMYGGQSTHIPVKVNMASVMPVIFSGAIMNLPRMLGILFGREIPQWYIRYFTPEGNIGIWIFTLIQLGLVIMFAFFYTAIQFNTVEYAKNLQQYGGFIPGIRPGRPTGEFLQKISNRVTFIGALALALIVTIPIVVGKFVPHVNLAFSGTAVIIVAGVIIETVKQIESLMMMKQYKGFLNK